MTISPCRSNPPVPIASAPGPRRRRAGCNRWRPRLWWPTCPAARIWCSTDRGRRIPITAGSGIRRSRPAGCRTAPGIGAMSSPGAGPGSTRPPGGSRRSITAAGFRTAEDGAGRRVVTRRSPGFGMGDRYIPSMRRRWSRSSGSAWASAWVSASGPGWPAMSAGCRSGRRSLITRGIGPARPM